MKFILLGATGWIGSHILQTALTRGHEIVAVARAVRTLPVDPRIHPLAADINNPEALAAALRHSSVVVSSVPFLAFNPDVLLTALNEPQVERYLCVGGAGSLKLNDGTDLVDSPDFPAEYRDEAIAGREYLMRLRQGTELDWAFLSPSASIDEGQSTAPYRVGGDTLLVGADGKSRIAVADYAAALVDELETPKHHRTRFTVGY